MEWHWNGYRYVMSIVLQRWVVVDSCVYVYVHGLVSMVSLRMVDMPFPSHAYRR